MCLCRGIDQGVLGPWIPLSITAQNGKVFVVYIVHYVCVDLSWSIDELQLVCIEGRLLRKQDCRLSVDGAVDGDCLCLCVLSDDPDWHE